MHLVNALTVVLIARQHPTANRDPFPGYSQANGYLGKVVAFVFGLAIGFKFRRTWIIGFKAGVVVSKKIKSTVRFSRLAVDQKTSFWTASSWASQEIHAPVEVVYLQSGVVTQGYTSSSSHCSMASLRKAQGSGVKPTHLAKRGGIPGKWGRPDKGSGSGLLILIQRPVSHWPDPVPEGSLGGFLAPQEGFGIGEFQARELPGSELSGLSGAGTGPTGWEKLVWKSPLCQGGPNGAKREGSILGPGDPFFLPPVIGAGGLHNHGGCVSWGGKKRPPQLVVARAQNCLRGTRGRTFVYAPGE